MWGGLDVISRRFNFIISYHNLCSDILKKEFLKGKLSIAESVVLDIDTTFTTIK